METIEPLGKYEIRRTIGRGAMGIVYEGWDPSIQRRVAIKTVQLSATADEESREGLARFRREARAAGRLAHPNIVSVYDYGETPAVAYIVMEYIDGPTLKSLLDRQVRFGMPEILCIMQDLLAGLEFSHGRGVVHRDVKPANVMLSSEDRTKTRAKIADFGIARIDSSNMTLAGTMMGTPAYMSPEQFMAETVDARTDIYSSGVLLYQLLTGEKPYEGGLSAIMHKVLNTEPPRPSQISVNAPPALDAVVKQAMAKRPDDRFTSAGAFAAALVAAASASAPEPHIEDATIATTPQPPVRASQPASLRRADPAKPKRSLVPMLAGAVLALLAAGGGGALLLFHAPGQTHPAVATAAPMPEPVRPHAGLLAESLIQPLAQPAIRAEPPPAPVAPPPAVTPAMIGDVFARILAIQHCALIGGDVRDNGDTVLTGLAEPGTEQAIRQAAAGRIGSGVILWRVVSTDTVFCPALAVLQSVAPPIGATEPRLDLALAGGRTALRDGEMIRPRLVMPNFVGYLRVDYLAHDGTVQHLYPQVAAGSGIAADKVRMFTPGEQVSIGDPAPGQPAWEVGPPYGTDMIIAVASSQSLFERPRPGNVEPMAGYLRDLEAAVQAVRLGGGKLAGTALPMEALAN